MSQCLCGEKDLVVGLGNYDKILISGYQCNLCQKKVLVVGMGNHDKTLRSLCSLW